MNHKKNKQNNTTTTQKNKSTHLQSLFQKLTIELTASADHAIDCSTLGLIRHLTKSQPIVSAVQQPLGHSSLWTISSCSGFQMMIYNRYILESSDKLALLVCHTAAFISVSLLSYPSSKLRQCLYLLVIYLTVPHSAPLEVNWRLSSGIWNVYTKRIKESFLTEFCDNIGNRT